MDLVKGFPNRTGWKVELTFLKRIMQCDCLQQQEIKKVLSFHMVNIPKPLLKI